MTACNRYAWPALLAVVGCCLTPRAACAQQGAWAILVRNAETEAGEPPFALIDEFGEVRRYVEPTPGVRLDRRIGDRVRVKHDTGRTLLASQLEFQDSLQPLADSAQRPARFRAPRQARALDRLDDGVVRTQFDDDLVDDSGVTPVGDDPNTPIDLDSIIAREAEELPEPEHETERISPILEGEVIATRESHESCPHCQDQSCREKGRCEPSRCECRECCNRRDCGGGSFWSCPVVGDALSLGGLCSHGLGGCDECWPDPTCCPPSQRGVYGRLEYLLWWVDGFDTPPLVTAGTTEGAAVLGAPGTTVLFGGELLDDTRSGLRFTLGAWLDDCRDYAIEFDALFLETETQYFSAGDLTGASVIGRPFYNLSPTDANDVILPPAEDAELVSYPNLIAGTVDVTATSEFDTFGVRLRTGLCCCGQSGCGDGCGNGCDPCARTRSITRTDLLVGYRHADLDEGLYITENLTSLDTANPGAFVVSDSFETENRFDGVDLGMVSEWRSRRWALELVTKVAVGVTQQHARINGFTTVSDGGASFTSTGGLLALPSNIGSYERDRFSVLPELSARVAYRVTPRVSLSAAYTLLYWANVLRPGDQIDLDIDPQGIPPATATTVRPEFAFNESSFWAHGLSFGVDYNY